MDATATTRVLSTPRRTPTSWERTLQGTCQCGHTLPTGNVHAVQRRSRRWQPTQHAVVTISRKSIGWIPAPSGAASAATAISAKGTASTSTAVSGKQLGRQCAAADAVWKRKPAPNQLFILLDPRLCRKQPAQQYVVHELRPWPPGERITLESHGREPGGSAPPQLLTLWGRAS